MRCTTNTEQTVEDVLSSLRRASANPTDAAYHVSGAFHALRHALAGRPLTASERDRLLVALAEAHVAAAPAFTDGREPMHFAEGMRAAVALVVEWGEPSDKRTLAGDALANAWARLRIARNLAHNAALLDEIADRGRRSTVRGLLDDARRAAS